MLRKLVLVLILGNLLLWAWAHGVLRPFGWAPARVEEPQRLHQQVHPDALDLLGPHSKPLTQRASDPKAAASAPAAASAASAASAAAAARAPASAPASAPAHAASGAVDARAGGGMTTCLRIGPYSDAPDARLGAALHAAGFDAQAREQDLPEQWMVLMGPYSDSATLQRKLDELRKLSLPADSFVPVTARTRYMPGISLGVFDKRAQAQVQLKRLQAHGVQTAHVVQRNLGMQARYWVLPALSPQQAQQLRALPALSAANMHAQACP